MTERIDRLPTGARFSFNGKNYVILRSEGNMSEVQEEEGRKWAWPNSIQITGHREPPYRTTLFPASIKVFWPDRK